jgi:hypothetical protein
MLLVCDKKVTKTKGVLGRRLVRYEGGSKSVFVYMFFYAF